VRICEQSEKVRLAILWIVLIYLLSFCRPRHDLALEVLALRHQLRVLQRQAPKPKLHRSDRYVWLLLMKVWPAWKAALILFQPETVIGWCKPQVAHIHPLAGGQSPDRGSETNGLAGIGEDLVSAPIAVALSEEPTTAR
jgi:hypothetical protein